MEGLAGRLARRVRIPHPMLRNPTLPKKKPERLTTLGFYAVIGNGLRLSPSADI
jgi:hypothetical protein